jgi:HEAT repeat protein
MHPPRTPLLVAGVLALLLSPAPRDLDVAIPPGSPLEWSAAFFAYTPPRAPLFPDTGAQAAAKAADPRSSAKPATSEADVRFANAFGQVRILTWDLALHLEWMTRVTPLPETGRASLRPRPPQYGDPLYWLALAPLLRLLLHPDALARSEVLAHLVELGEPVLPVLGAASSERELAPACRELRALIPVDLGPLPTPPGGDTPRAQALARIVLEECLRDQPYDPSDDFARRLYLFAAEAEPLLMAYAQHPSLELARNAVAALGRYETRSALQFLATLAAGTDDPVTLVRALAALGRYRGPLDVAPLLARLARTDEPVQRAALIGALGRLGLRQSAPALLALGEEARKAADSDLLISVLSALAHIAWAKSQPELAAFATRIAEEARELGRSVGGKMKPDLPDAPRLRADTLRQLATLVRSQADPSDERVREELLTLAQPAPLDGRLSELGVGGTDPLGSLAPPVRFLYLEGLLRAGPAGLERLAALVRRSEIDTALRGRALALLPYDTRGELAASLATDELQPHELRIQALEVLLGDLHPKLDELCRAQLSQSELARPRPSVGALYLAMRAVRFLSETGKLTVRECLPLFPFVQRPLAERAAQVDELEARLRELAEGARTGRRRAELEADAGALTDYVLERRLNAFLDPGQRAGLVDALLNTLEPLRKPRVGPEAVDALLPSLLAILLGGEPDWFGDPGRKLFEPLVPLAEELLLALGRTRDPQGLELLLTALKNGARELRAHAALALGLLAQPGAAEALLPALLDEDPFVRFCAAESLRHLLGREHALDWTSAPLEERVAAAEELRGFLLERR